MNLEYWDMLDVLQKRGPVGLIKESENIGTDQDGNIWVRKEWILRRAANKLVAYMKVEPDPLAASPVAEAEKPVGSVISIPVKVGGKQIGTVPVAVSAPDLTPEQLDRLRRSVAERNEPDPSEIPINPVFFPDRCATHCDVSRKIALGIDSGAERTGSKIEIVGE